MANWSNVRLLVAGPVEAIELFRREAKPFLGFAKRPRASLPVPLRVKHPLFALSMLRGEGGDLFEHSTRNLVGRRRLVQYCFQTSQSEQLPHFQRISQRFRDLKFVVAWDDSDPDSNGSAYILRGRKSIYKIGNRRSKRILLQFIPNPESESADLWWQEEEAFRKMLDVSVERWRHYLR